MKTYCFDIDGVICTNTDGEYEKALPDYQVIDRINQLFSEGNKIILFTARGSTTGIDWKALTQKQMAAWKVRYHELFLGKPQADLYIDDRAINSLDWLKSKD